MVIIIIVSTFLYCIAAVETQIFVLIIKIRGKKFLACIQTSHHETGSLSKIAPVATPPICCDLCVLLHVGRSCYLNQNFSGFWVMKLLKCKFITRKRQISGIYLIIKAFLHQIGGMETVANYMAHNSKHRILLLAIHS